MVDARRHKRALLAVDLDNVKPRLLFGRVLLQPRLCSGDDLRLLGRCDGFARRTVAGVSRVLTSAKITYCAFSAIMSISPNRVRKFVAAVCQPRFSRYSRAAFSPHAPFIAVHPDAFRKIS